MNQVASSETRGVMRADLYRTITDQIVAAIEAGTGNYQLPWHRGGTGTPLNAITGRHYRGINTLLLWAAAMQRGYTTGEWASRSAYLQKPGAARRAHARSCNGRIHRA